MSLALPEAPSRAEEAPDVSALSAEPGDLACDKGCGRTFTNASGKRAHEMFCRGDGTRKKKTGAERRREAKAKATPAGGATPARPREARPKTSRATPQGRKSAAGILGLVWTGAAKAFPSPAGARAMLWQAPGAGRVLDQALAGSVIDRKVLQRVSGDTEKWKAVSALVSLPVMCAMVETNPALYGPLYGFMRAGIEENLEAALDAALEAKARQARIKAKANEAGVNLETDDEGNEIEDVPDAVLEELLGRKPPKPEAAHVVAVIQ